MMSVSCSDLLCYFLFDGACKGSNGGGLSDSTNLHADSKVLQRLPEHSNQGHGSSPEIKEVVVHSYFFYSQGFGPHLSEEFFRRGTRCNIFGKSCPGIGRRQRLSINFPIGHHRKLVQNDE